VPGIRRPGDVSSPAVRIQTVDTGGEAFLRGDGFPADPADPEPIRSTGSDSADLITSDDLTSFECLVDLDRGAEDFFDPTRSFYETVSEASLFLLIAATRPRWRSVCVLGSEIGRRRDRRFALRNGLETATAGSGETISGQAGKWRFPGRNTGEIVQTLRILPSQRSLPLWCCAPVRALRRICRAQSRLGSRTASHVSIGHSLPKVLGPGCTPRCSPATDDQTGPQTGHRSFSWFPDSATDRRAASSKSSC
jgi:hypothetical protein